MARDPAPRTVLPPRPGGGGGAGRGAPDPFDRLAAPVLAFADTLAGAKASQMAALLEQAGRLLDRFAADARSAGAVPASVPPARYALALVLDHAARSNRAFDLAAWSAGARRHLFDGRDLSLATLRDFARKAAEAGPDYAPVRRFLDACLVRLEGERARVDRPDRSSWTGIVLVLVAAYGLAVAGWVGYVEWRHQRALLAVIATETLRIGLDRDGPVPDLAGRLDGLAELVRRVGDESAKAPARLFTGWAIADARARAEADYAAAADRHLPQVLVAAIDTALATEGTAAGTYDALRAWSVLSGQAPWSAAYLAGWAADRAPQDETLAGLAPHLRHLSPPGAGLAPPDAELLDQAVDFAATTPEAERAWLELRRSDAVAALPGWRGDTAVPGLAQVVQRRSGRPMDEPLSGLFTAAGWRLAHDTGAGLAVQTARTEAARLFPAARPETRNDTPDRVLDLLQRATVAAWADYLRDIQVRPFSDPDTAIQVSGRLSLAASPLTGLLNAVWSEAGGTDRSRSHAQQLVVATTFAPMIQYVEQGRMAEIAGLFAGLNVALGAMDRDSETGLQRLMTAQDRAKSIAALRAAPQVVVAIVEDVLAQTGSAHADLLTNPLTRAWQAEALAACREATEGRFPFTDGPDADPASVARLFAAGGTLDRFVTARAAPYLDTTASPWRWKPEARFTGLSPDSAAFLERAAALAGAFSDAGGGFGAAMTLAALAERGKAIVIVGGQGGPVETGTDTLALAWPGPDPARGIEVSFQTSEGTATLAQPGPWGLLRLLAPLRLRERDGGRRFLVDLRAGGARLFVEMGFADETNPLSRRGLIGGFACPQVL